MKTTNFTKVTLEEFSLSFDFNNVLDEYHSCLYDEFREQEVEDLGYLCMILLSEMLEDIQYAIDYCDVTPDESYHSYSEMYEYFYREYYRLDYDKGDQREFIEVMA